MYAWSAMWPDVKSVQNDPLNNKHMKTKYCVLIKNQIGDEDKNTYK